MIVQDCLRSLEVLWFGLQPAVKHSCQQRHRHPSETDDDEHVESGISEQKRPRLNHRTSYPEEQSRNYINRYISDQSHLPLREGVQCLARQREPAFKATKFFGVTVAFGQVCGQSIPFQVFG